MRRAVLSLSEYKARFKDLTAEEEQKVEEYDQQGKLTAQRRIASGYLSGTTESIQIS